MIRVTWFVGGHSFSLTYSYSCDGGAVSRTMTEGFSRRLSLATHGQFDGSKSDIQGQATNWCCVLKVFISPARAAVAGVDLSNLFWPL